MDHERTHPEFVRPGHRQPVVRRRRCRIRGLGRALGKAGRLAEAEATYAAGPDPTAMNGRSPDEKIEAFLRRLEKRGG
jgi:hypothetical protein